MASPEAVFDCLYTGNVVQRHFGDVARAEFHLFTYLGCLLSIYSGHAADDWTYTYAGTKIGAPFSAELDLAIGDILRSGMALGNDEFVKITQTGVQEVQELASMSSFSGRVVFLEAACSSVLALPVGIVRDALSYEPNLRPLTRLSTSRRLLDPTGLDLLYEHFEALRNAVGNESKDLLVPATVWLSYLAESAKRERSEVRA
jgi:hypothetical protein